MKNCVNAVKKNRTCANGTNPQPLEEFVHVDTGSETATCKACRVRSAEYKKSLKLGGRTDPNRDQKALPFHVAGVGDFLNRDHYLLYQEWLRDLILEGNPHLTIRDLPR